MDIKKWGEAEVQLALFDWLNERRRMMILANFQPRGWRECDIFSITDALYFHEIEVKVSRSDFSAEFTNKRYKHMVMSSDERYKNEKKYMPRTYCFACPSGLLREEDMPEHAGLIWVERDGALWGQLRHRVEIVKEPPILRDAMKMSDEQMLRITKKVWSRYAPVWRGIAQRRMGW